MCKRIVRNIIGDKKKEKFETEEMEHIEKKMHKEKED